MAEVKAQQPADEHNLTGNITDESVYDELLRRSGGNFTGHEGTIREFEIVCRKLHSTARQIGNAYREIAKWPGLNPGKIEVVLGGGRAKGKPVEEDSDLDLCFHVENPIGGLGSIHYLKYAAGHKGATDEQTIKMQLLIKRVADICNEQGVPNKFHIMEYGDSIPEQYRQEDQLLLARV